MRYRILFFVTVFVLFVKCNNYDNIDYSVADENVFELNNVLNDNNISIYDYLDSIKLIQLETNDISLLSDIVKVLITDEHIYIFDAKSGGGVSIFKTNGDYVGSIPHGNGPGEISRVIDISYDYNQHYLYVYSHYINKYTAKGTFIDCYEQSPKMCDFCPIKNGFVCYQADFQSIDSKPSIMFLDTAFNEIRRYVLDSKFIRKGYNQFYPFGGDTIVFYRPFDNYIYHFSLSNPDYYGVKYCFSYPKLELNTSELNGSSDFHNFMKIIDSDKYYFSSIKETDSHLFTVFQKDEKNIFLIINKNNRTSICGKFSFDDNLLPSFTSVRCNLGEYFVGVLNESLLSIKNRDSVINANSKFLSVEDTQKLRNHGEEDNPMLVMFKFK